MPQGIFLLTNHSSYASQLTIPRGKLEAFDDFASNLKGASPLLKSHVVRRSSILHLPLSFQFFLQLPFPIEAGVDSTFRK
jgi:hypothetical protein